MIGLIECCRRNGDLLEVPCIMGRLKIVHEANGLLVVKNTGRRSRGKPIKGRVLLIRLRAFQPPDQVLSSYHLASYGNQVMHVLDEQELSPLAILNMKQRAEMGLV